MKQFLIFAFLFITASSFGQVPDKSDTISFCFIKYKIPPGCKAASEYQVKCDDYSMTWIYLTPQTIQTTPDQMIKQMAGQMKKFKKEAITCYLLDKQVKGYKISFKTEQGTGHRLMAYGFANEQLVLVQLSLDKEPKTNEDIPAFPRQMIRLSN
jgi:hypothetical protein